MRRTLNQALLIGAAAVGLSCSDGSGSQDSGGTTELTGERSDCDPVAPSLCGLPFPSTFYMEEDASSPTGWRVALGPTTLPENRDDYQPDPSFWNEKDGWSVLTPVMAHFPGVSLAGTVNHEDIGAYADADVKTVILDVETGERVPHYVELDVSLGESDRQVIKMRPAIPLRYGARYVAGFRGLELESGGSVEVSEAFTALRDGTTTDSYDIEHRRPVYDDVVFPALEADGWSRDEVQLAWDFVTASQEGITGKARWIRDDVISRADEIEWTINEVDEYPKSGTAFRLHGEMTVPLYTEEDDSGSVLTRGDDGMPFHNGTTTVPFTVIVPEVLVNEKRPGPVLQYGHGLLGGQSEVHAGYLSDLANDNGYVIVAVDWTGMKSSDVDDITLMIVGEIERFAMIPERSHQGFAEFVAAMQLVTGELAQSEYLTVEGDDGSTVSLVDPDTRYYYGNSQGGIMGGAYAALASDIDRAVLGVAGSPYELLLTRSKDFDPFFLLFQAKWDDPAETSILIAYMQTLWDPGEAAGWMRSMNESPIEGSSPTEVLVQVAIGDAQVTTLGAHIMARSYGAKLIEEPVREVWGLETVASGHQGSALVEWDYGIEEPYENVPPEDGTEDPHEYPRRSPAGMQQLAHFLETGEVQHFCSGPCDSDDQ